VASVVTFYSLTVAAFGITYAAVSWAYGRPRCIWR